MASANLLTTDEIAKIKASGGGAILNKVEFLKAKLKDGTGSDKDVDAYNTLATRCRDLIGNKEPDQAYPPDLEKEMADRIAKLLTEMSEKVDAGDITEDEFVANAGKVCKQVERMCYGRHAFLKCASRLKVGGLPITFYSAALGDTVKLVASETAARKEPIDGMAVYTVDEVVGILKADTSMEDWSKLHLLKKSFNGQLDLSFNGGGR